MMIARHADLAETTELDAREESVRGAEIDRERALDLFVGIDRLFKFFAAERTARSDDGEPICAGVLIRLCVRDDLLLREEAVGLDTCLMARRLCAVFAVLAAAPAAPVDDGAQVDMVAAELPLKPVCPLLELVERSFEEQRSVGVASQTIARDDLLGKFCDISFAHTKIPALS